MPEAQKAPVDLDRVLETLRRGVRRADVVMGIGLNAASHDPPISHILAPEKPLVIHLVKEQLSGQEKAHVSAEFAKWVKASGLRELMETFSVYLLQLYVVLFQLLEQAGKLGALEKVTPDKFERQGIGEQIETLAKAVTISQNDIRIIASLNQARNCYAHRLGRVGLQDIDKSTGKLELIWRTVEVEGVYVDGTVIKENELYGRPLEKDTMISMRLATTTKEARIGDELVLTKSELKEICWTVLTIGQELFKQVVDIARKEGRLIEKVNDTLDDPKPV